jgi:tripartite motif-containing protein 71
MALTTYVKGRAYDWSHAIGRASANGTGFNYPQTMCLGTDSDVYVANRGNENNFGMRVNHIKVGGPGEEELLAEFATYGDADGNTIWPFGVAVDKNGEVYVTDEWKSTVSVFDAKGKFIRKWGTPGSGPGQLKGPAGIVCEQNGNVIVVDSGNNRLQVFTPQGKLVAQCGRTIVSRSSLRQASF